MANATGAATTAWNCPNYVGPLFLAGQTQTPFLNMIGGLNQGGNGARLVSQMEYEMSQPYSLEAAAQPAYSENDSLTAPTPDTYVRSQITNTCQIYHQAVSVSYYKQANRGSFSGLQVLGNQPVQSERDWQVQVNLRQIALDADYTFLNGSYASATGTSSAPKTRGIITAISSNTVSASSAALSKTKINELLRTMAGNGAQFTNMVLFANAFNVQKISDIYGFAPMDRTVGGVAVSTILTEFCRLSVVYEPQVPAATVLIADMSVVRPVFNPVPGKGVLFYEELSRTGASEKGQIYGHMGIDYAHEYCHGTITSTATS
jgi:hypothetical protein